MKQFFCKYRGKVVANKDPLHLGRIQVSVPAIFGEGRQSWAMPCTPYAGQDVGLFMIPPIDANIWVEFEGGDPDYPIWTGCFWGSDQLPQNAKVEEPAKVQVFRTSGITVTLSSLEENNGKVTLEIGTPVVQNPLKMVFNTDGIELNNNNVTTAKLTADTIELKTGENSTVTIAQNSIQLKQTSIEIQLTSNSIDLTCNPATVSLSNSSGIEIKNMPASAKISSSGIELEATPASAKITPAQIELSNAAGNIKVSPISVNVNNGALEVI